MTARHQVFALRLLLLAVLATAWQTASGHLVPEFFISRPSAVIATLWDWARSGDLFFQAAITALEAFSGFAIGGVLGIGAGILLGRAQRLADVVNPFITAFYSLPKVALAPLFILWFGIGLDMKIILTAAIVFFLVFLNTYTGTRAVDRELLSILRLMGANERQLLTKVVFPSAVTWVFTGLRISVPYALIGAIVGELMASNRGLGFLLADSAGQFNTAGVFAALAAIMGLSFTLNWGVKRLEALAMPWQTHDADREPTL